MLDTVKKAAWLLRKRPVHFLGTFGQYWRFFRTNLLRGLFLTEDNGIFFGSNVRIQAIGALTAERPYAKVSIGDDSIIYEKAKIEAYDKGHIAIGKSVIIGEAKIIAREAITIGDRVITSWNVFIQDFDPHPIEPELRAQQMQHMCENFRPAYRESKKLAPLNWKFPTSPISIGNDVWIGANVTILKGAKIGNGCVVATGAVVTAGDYPDRSILAGAPAKAVKTI